MSKTGYYTHSDCRKHEMGPGHPECPARLDAIEDRLLISGVSAALDHREAPLASLADIELAHDRMHVAAIRGLSLRLVEEEEAGGSPYMQLDTDTAMNRHTWTAALRASDPDWAPQCVFRVETGAGSHTGPSGRFGHLEYEAEIYAWVLDKLGVHR